MFGFGSDNDIVWQDREIRFDITQNQVKLRKGEEQVQVINKIEDYKGNPQENGFMVISNLRLIWRHLQNKSINISIGYETIQQIQIKVVYSNILGQKQQLLIRARQNGCKFQFIFQTTNQKNNKIFNVFQQVCRIYENSKMYREMRQKSAQIYSNQLKLMEGENFINQYDQVAHITAESQNQGIIVFTNIRIVWWNVEQQNVNLTMPYISIKSMKKKDSKFGPILVVEIQKSQGGDIFGFQIHAIDKVFMEVSKLWQAYKQNPQLTPNIKLTSDETNRNWENVETKEDDIEIVDEEYNSTNKNINQYLESMDDNQIGIVFSDELGLAIQKPHNTSVEELWKIINVKK